MKLLSKSDICDTLGITAKYLRAKVFTDAVLLRMGLTLEAYKKIRVFTVEQSKFLREYLGIK